MMEIRDYRRVEPVNNIRNVKDFRDTQEDKEKNKNTLLDKIKDSEKGQYIDIKV